jgi:hypothetical protein
MPGAEYQHTANATIIKDRLLKIEIAPDSTRRYRAEDPVD